MWTSGVPASVLARALLQLVASEIDQSLTLQAVPARRRHAGRDGVDPRHRRRRGSRRGRGLAPPLRHADHACDGLRGDRSPRRATGARRGGPVALERIGARARRGDAHAGPLRRRLADRPARVAPGLSPSGAPARDRPATHDRRRRAPRRAPLRPAECARSVGARRPARADGRRARPGGGHRAAAASRDPSRPQRRERAQRRDLRPAAAHRSGHRGRRRRPPSSHTRSRGTRGDRLRDRGRRGRRAVAAAVVVLAGRAG